MVAATRKTNEFIEEILTRIDEKFNARITKNQKKMALLMCSKQNLEQEKSSNRQIFASGACLSLSKSSE